MRHAKETEFYMQQLRRIARKENPKIKIGKKALVEFAKHLEKHSRLIFKKALFSAGKEHRKIIKTKDIENAVKERSLLE